MPLLTPLLSSLSAAEPPVPRAPADRTLELDALWAHLYATTPRPLTFSATTREEWQTWRSSLVAKLRELLGPDRPRTPLRAEVLEREDFGAFVRERVVYDTEPHVSVTAYLFLPKRLSQTPRPAIVCLHGHGPHGKDNVAGQSDGNLRRQRHLRKSRYDFAVRLAERGYVCLAADARGWGERSVGFFRKSATDPSHPFGGRRDPCNVHFLHAQLFGLSLLWLNIWDDMRGVDFLASRPEVDAARIGSMGFSWGGTRSMWLAALDSRIAAANVGSYLTSFREYALRLCNTCGSQLPSGILTLCELGDVAALIAPRPLHVESGLHDTGFPVEAAREAFATVARCYQVLGASDRCQHEVFDGGHRFGDGGAFGFFDRWLGEDA